MLLRHIRYLLAVAEHANFTRAAEALHVSQPALSQQVKQLESTLHTKLLDRSGRTVRLTDAGEVYGHYARLALQNLNAGERAISDVKDLSRGTLRVAMTPTFYPYLMGPLIGQFNARYPGIRLTVNEMTQDRIEQELTDDRLDLGIAFTDTPSSNVDAEPLFCETLNLVVGSGHPVAGTQAPLAPTDMARHDLILLDKGLATRQHIDRYFEEQGVTPRIAVETNSVSAIIELVRRGQLATILPDATALHQVDLSFVAVSPPLPQRTAALLRRAGAHESAASKAFAALAAQDARERHGPTRDPG